MASDLAVDAAGLSPRVRGSLLEDMADQAGAGSIPASAGEPLDNTPKQPDAAVYPRGCGGAGAVLCIE